MSDKERSRFATHLFRVGVYIGAFFWLALVYVGGNLASRPEIGTHSHLTGWATLLVAAGAAILTVSHWVKYLPVILGGGILGGLLAIGTGHLLNNKPFPRPVAAGVTALFLACGLISRPLAKRPLTMLDRVALMAFLAAFVGGIVIDTPTSGLIGLGIGFGCLFAAWLRDWLSCKRESEGTARHL
jgi:hypothetical protein